MAMCIKSRKIKFTFITLNKLIKCDVKILPDVPFHNYCFNYRTQILVQKLKFQIKISVLNFQWTTNILLFIVFQLRSVSWWYICSNIQCNVTTLIYKPESIKASCENIHFFYYIQTVNMQYTIFILVFHVTSSK